MRRVDDREFKSMKECRYAARNYSRRTRRLHKAIKQDNDLWVIMEIEFDGYDENKEKK